MKKNVIRRLLKLSVIMIPVTCAWYGKAQILIDPYYISPATKNGYKLIFRDEFNGNNLDLQKWDISTSNKPDDVPCKWYLYDFMLGQVTVKDGMCLLKTEKAQQDVNTNCLVYPDCERGVSGEIKNTSWRDPYCIEPDFPGVCFQNYDFPVGSYIEIRAKTTDADCNAGSAFWLTGGNQEIDVFETSGDEDDFTSGFFSSRIINGKEYTEYERYRNWWDKLWGLEGKEPKIISLGFTMNRQIEVTKTLLVWDDVNQKWTEQTFTQLKAGPHIKPSDMFITYGVHLTKEGMKFYINDQEFFSYNIDDYDFKDGKIVDMRSKVIRLSTGQLTGGGNTACSVPCPSQMEVDYVRVFLPDSQKAISWFDNKTVICEGQQEIIKATYIAGVEYAWSSTGFDIEKEWSGSPDSFVKIRSKAGAVPGQSYPVILNSTFPDGHTELLSRSFFLAGDGGVLPPAELSVTCFKSICTAEILEPQAGCNCPAPNIYEWSWDDGLTWNNYGTYYSFLYNKGAKLCVRTRNCNGVSEKLCKTLPKPNNNDPAFLDNSNEGDKVIAYPNPVKDHIAVQNIDFAENISNEPLEISVYDICGKMYIRDRVSGADSIDTTKLPPGFYIMAIKLPGGATKFVKIHKIS